MRTSKLSRWGFSSAVGIALSLPAYAVDGVVLINQNAALAGNVTPADRPGFPVTISVSGSYKLSSNLIVPDANTTAIEIIANDVTIDLNGFSIIGPTVCSGSPVSCSPVASNFESAVGISSGGSNTTILNGTIRGLGGAGVLLFGENSHVERIRAISNGSTGILMFGTVTSSTGSMNGGAGINADVVIGSTVMANRLDGIAGTLVMNSRVSGNGQVGILSGFGGGTIIGNSVSSNGTQGISVSCPSTVVSNAATHNSGGDIFTSGSGCTRANNAPAP